MRSDCGESGWNPSPIKAHDYDMCRTMKPRQKRHIEWNAVPQSLIFTDISEMVGAPGSSHLIPVNVQGVVLTSSKKSNGDVLVHWDPDHRPDQRPPLALRQRRRAPERGIEEAQ